MLIRTLRRLGNQKLAIMTAAMMCAFTSVPAGSQETDSDSSKTIKIGYLGSLTSIGKEVGQTMLNGMELYIDEIHHTMAGKKVDFIVENDGSDRLQAVAKVHKLIEQDKVSILTGLSLSNVLNAVAPVVEAAQVPLVIGVAAADDVTQRRHSDWVVRTGYASSQPAHALGDYAYTKLGYRKVVTFGADYVYGYEAVGGFQQTFEDAGGRVIQKIWVPLTLKDYSSFIKQIRAADADAVLLCMVGPSATLVGKQLRALGYKLPIIGVAHTFDESLYGDISDEFNGAIGCNPYTVALDNAANRHFVKAYRDKFGVDPSYYSAFGFTAMMAIDKAVEAAGGNLDKQKIAAALRKVSLTNDPRGPATMDQYGNIVDNMYIYRVERVKGKLQNTVISTYPMVSQFWKYKPAKYLQQPAYSREYPPCNYCLEKQSGK